MIDNFGYRLRTSLKISGMNQLQLCTSSGISIASMSKFVNSTRLPDFHNLQRIIDSLPNHIDVRWLVMGEE